MGRLNIDYIKYILKNKLIKIIPYKYRKPFILIFTVLSLYGYFKFMIMLSARLFGTPSTYLLIMQNAVMSVLDILVRSFGQNRSRCNNGVTGGYTYIQIYTAGIQEERK